MRATRQLAQEAGIYLHVRKFEIINQVGAVSINARLNCEAFANAHSSTAHYDKDSFVGLAWRPQGESICCGKLIDLNMHIRTFAHFCIATGQIYFVVLPIHQWLQFILVGTTNEFQ